MVLHYGNWFGVGVSLFRRRWLAGLVILCGIGLAGGFSSSVQAQITGDLEGIPDPIKIAIPKPSLEGVVPDGETLVKEAQEILENDLRLSRNVGKPNFLIIPDTLQIEQIHNQDQSSGRVDFAAWGRLNAQYVIKITIRSSPGRYQLDLLLYDVFDKRHILGKRSGMFARESFRRSIHEISDSIVERITPYRGIATTQIAFVNELKGVKEIYLVDYDGHKSSLVQVTQFNSLCLFPTWSPDGEYIAYSSYKNNWCDAFVQRVRNLGTGNQYRTLAEYPGNNLAPRWNPSDSREMVISLSHKGNAEIFLINSDGKILKRLTTDASIDQSACFSPDGQQIVWSSDRAGGYPQLYIMDRDGGNVRRLTNLQGLRCDTPVWSPVRLGDDYRIAFYGHQGGPVGDIYIIRPSGEGAQQLTESGPNNSNPTWSPDGMYLAYSSTRRGRAHIYMMQFNGLPPLGSTEHLRLTEMEGNNLSPSWSP